MRLILLLPVILFLASCGWTVPALDTTAKTPYDTAYKVNRIAFQVKCELATAVYNLLDSYQEKSGNRLAFMTTWAAKATLKLSADERSNLGPGAFFTPPGTFSLGAGGELSANATRSETIGFFFIFSDLIEKKGSLLRLKKQGPCPPHQSDVLIESDLKLKEWIESLGPISAVREGVSDPFVTGGPLDVSTHEVNFLVEISGSATPTWRLVAVTVNPSGPFLGASRTQTENLLITIGPTELVTGGRGIRPSVAVEQQHLAAQIGQAVGAAIQSQRR